MWLCCWLGGGWSCWCVLSGWGVSGLGGAVCAVVVGFLKIGCCRVLTVCVWWWSTAQVGRLPANVNTSGESDHMSAETLEWLNTQTLIGYTERRGNAWHYRAAARRRRAVAGVSGSSSSAQTMSRRVVTSQAQRSCPRRISVRIVFSGTPDHTLA